MAAAAPVITEANLSPVGRLTAPPPSKKPMYVIRDVSSVRPQPSLVFRQASSAKQSKHVLFGALCSPRLRVLKAIPVELSRRGEHYYAKFKVADEFGVGESMSLALEDLGKTLSELFIGLDEKKERLGPDLSRLQGLLSRYIAFRKK